MRDIGCDRFDLRQWLTLGRKSGAIGNVWFTARLAFEGFTGGKEFGGVFKCGHGFLLFDVSVTWLAQTQIAVPVWLLHY